MRIQDERPLIAPQWFKWAARPKARRTIAPVAGATVGLLVGIAFIAHDKLVPGAIVIAIALLVGILSTVSPALGGKLERWFNRIGFWVAQVISWVILLPLYVIVFTAVRAWHVVTRHDPLQLSDSDDGPSYWLPADAHERKVRHASAMFATHRVQHRRLGLLAVIALIPVAILLAEATLRIKGFGKPILYVTDPHAGFYPKPNQVTQRSGGRVEINAFGMRSPQYSLRKPDGVFRILLLGDSTLYGGSYVDQDELYSRRLEEHLRKLANGRRVEVLAMGVNAWGPFHELGYVQKFGAFDADLTIIALPTGDIYRPLYGLEAVPFLSAQRPPRLALEEVVNHLAWRLRMTQIGPMSPEQLQWNGKRGLDAYARLARLLSDRGAEVMFEVLPSQSAAIGTANKGERRDLERIRAHVTPEGAVHVGFPEGMFRGMTGRLYHDGVHLHVDGHRLYAQYLRDSVARSSSRWQHWLSRPGVPQHAEASH